jgi:hypothetical protein
MNRASGALSGSYHLPSKPAKENSSGTQRAEIDIRGGASAVPPFSSGSTGLPKNKAAMGERGFAASAAMQYDADLEHILIEKVDRLFRSEYAPAL